MLALKQSSAAPLSTRPTTTLSLFSMHRQAGGDLTFPPGHRGHPLAYCARAESILRPRNCTGSARPPTPREGSLTPKGFWIVWNAAAAPVQCNTLPTHNPPTHLKALGCHGTDCPALSHLSLLARFFIQKVNQGRCPRRAQLWPHHEDISCSSTAVPVWQQKTLHNLPVLQTLWKNLSKAFSRCSIKCPAGGPGHCPYTMPPTCLVRVEAP